LASNVVPIGNATGPRTPAGKRRSSMNALKCGLYSPATVIQHVESVEEFNRFARAIVADLGAGSTLEIALAERLCSALWRGRRVRRYEAERLSEVAGRAELITKTAANFRGQVVTIEGYADSVAALRSPAPIPADTLRLAVLGFACLYDHPEVAPLSAKRLCHALTDLACEASAPAKVVRREVNAARKLMPRELACAEADEFVDTTSWMLRQVAKKVRDEGSAIDDKARRAAQTNALLLPRDEAVRVEDAERRIDRQVTAALADFRAVRELTTVSLDDDTRTYANARAR